MAVETGPELTVLPKHVSQTISIMPYVQAVLCSDEKHGDYWKYILTYHRDQQKCYNVVKTWIGRDGRPDFSIRQKEKRSFPVGRTKRSKVIKADLKSDTSAEFELLEAYTEVMFFHPFL